MRSVPKGKNNPKKHIVMFIDAWFPLVGGGQVHVWELSKKIVDLGYTVTIFTRNLGKWSETHKDIKVIRVGRFTKFQNIIGRLDYLLQALFFALKEDYQIAHLHAFSPGLLAPFIKFFKRKPVVFTAHGQGMKIAGLNINGGYLQDLVFYKIKYDLLISVAKNTLLKKTNSGAETIIPNGVNLELFQLAHRKRGVVKNVTYLGRLSYEKGVDILIEALRKLKSRSIKLTIIGDGVERKKLEKLSEGLNVKFMGSVSGMRLMNKLKEADLLVLPSRTEGHPITLLEGWASKIPVLVTNVGDNARYIKNNQNGFIAEPSINSIHSQLMKIVKLNDLERVCLNGLVEVEKYSWERIAKKTHTYYRRLTSS